MGYSKEETMAGFEEMERFGVLNIMPSLVQNFGMSRHQVFECNVIEVFQEIQRISVYNKCLKELNNQALQR